MNAVEIYKKLPKKNCGECRQKNCMPFALSLIKGEAELSECPYLTGDEVNELKKTIVHSDWREELKHVTKTRTSLLLCGQDILLK